MADSYVFSTLSADVAYTDYEYNADGHSTAVRKVLIRGGAGVSDKYLRTPRGVVTRVNEDELAFLMADDVFKLHMKNKHITVEKKNHDPEKVAADMEQRDASAPVVPEDYNDKDKVKPVVDGTVPQKWGKK